LDSQWHQSAKIPYLADKQLFCTEIPICTASFGLRSFGSSGPTAWNDMPAYLHNLDLSVSDFRQLLKTALFQTVLM